jgi:hypothetical protein
MNGKKSKNDDTGVVLYWKDPAQPASKGAYYRLAKTVWDKYRIGDAQSGLPAALVTRGAIVATMKDATHPAGSWSTLLNMAALLDAHKTDKAKALKRVKGRGR